MLNISIMCGIAGSLRIDNMSIRSIINALNKLQNRGYDSAGISTIIDGVIQTHKNITTAKQSAMMMINESLLLNIETKLSIGHTRWATHGEKTIENAHPHTDDKGRFSLVHNGIIENYMELKKELLNNGYQFYGQTDSEVVVKYADFMLNQGFGFEDLQKKLSGSWAILILDTLNPDKIYFLKNGSPLIVGFGSEGKIMFVSELFGFDDDIEHYFAITDGDYGFAEFKEDTLETIFKSSRKYDLATLIHTSECSTPDPYPHWTLKEIYDQPFAINSLLYSRIKPNPNVIMEHEIFFPELNEIKDELMETEHFIFLACGTSYHAAQIGAKFFKELNTSATLEVIDGADFEIIDIPRGRKTVIILLSQSGETKDLYRALLIGKAQGIKTIGIINLEKTLIAREVDHCLYLKAGREHAVASTKSFTNQVIMLYLLGLWLSPQLEKSIRRKYLSALDSLASDFCNIINQSITEIPNIIPYFNGKTDCFILGRQASEWISKEGALKIKEISYIHAEGFSAAALKHGPFALLSDETPVILCANDDAFFTKIENATAEIKSRKAKVIFITNKKEVDVHHIDYLFYFETKSIFFSLISIAPLQILGYLLSVEKGHHPDYPRNLAKVVTVE